jgi:transcription termination factor Rho
MTATTTIQKTAVPRQAQAVPVSLPASGLVDIGDGGHAFIRTSGYRRGATDIAVSAGQIRQ